MFHFDVILDRGYCYEQGIMVVTRPDIPVPTRRVRTYSVLNRDGTQYELTEFYEDISISVKFNFMALDNDSWGKRKSFITRFVMETETLSFTDDMDVFYRVKNVTVSSVERTGKRKGAFTATFVCDPYRYYSSGRNFTGKSKNYSYNPGAKCFPEYELTGSGTARLTVNGYSATVNITGSPVTIDTRAQEATRSDGKSINSSVSGDYEKLVLVPGKNTISCTGAALRVKPNWRQI